MKTLMLTSILAFLLTAGTTVKAQDYLGLPGDNLNLYAVMNLFQESETIEGFEKTLNDENSRINNLDLNGDNYVDYIMVTDYVDNDNHNIVLQVALNPNEKQDVAVFTVQRFRDGAVQIQLIGDEALYGRNYIVEPIYDETPNPGYNGKRGNRNVAVVRTTTYEIAAWPMIRFIYHPRYTGWHSSWHWGYYPVYWNPWRPFYYHHYYGYHYNYYPLYHSHYRHWDRPRYSRYHDFYYSNHRSYSPLVVVNINKGNYKTTYSRPESRRDGEALYARTHSERSSTTTSSRRSSTTAANRAGTNRSTGTEATSSRRSAGSSGERTVTSSGRRSTESVNGRTNSNAAGGNAGTSRRTTETVSSSRNVNTNNSSSRRPVSTASERPAVNSSTTRSTSTVNNSRGNSSTSGTYRRPAPAASEKPAASRASQPGRTQTSPANRVNSSSGSERRPSATASPRTTSRPEQARTSTARSPRQSTSSAGQSDRRSSNTAAAAKRTETSKESESRKSRR